MRARTLAASAAATSFMAAIVACAYLLYVILWPERF